ncbi:alpha/beta hydrolase [Streptomyces sp. 049-1]|uniref:alpha/beta hydrolase n=1 Tax=Streptomyces sp. 049-1 TaxID=2789264 RepID=UPI00398061B5
MANRTPVVFIHGLWLHASCWDAWTRRFFVGGFEPVAPGWPGEPDTVGEARQRAAAIDGVGVDDVVSHYADIVRSFETAPVLIGHSLGGLIVQRLLGMNLGRGAVAIASAPIEGVELPSPYADFCVKFPALSHPENIARSPEITLEQFRYAFANAVSEDEAASLFDRYTMPSPGRTLFEAAFTHSSRNSRSSVDTGNAGRGPLLLISGQEDCLVPDAITRAAYKLYGDSRAITGLKQFVDRGHSMIIDSGWRTIADYTLGWLNHMGVRGEPSSADRPPVVDQAIG